MAFNQQLSVFGQVAPATTGTAGQVLVSAGSSASSYWASAIPVSAYSAQFNGSSYLNNLSNNTTLQMGSGDFTIEFWMYSPSIAAQVLFDGRPAGAGQSGNGALQISLQANGSIIVIGLLNAQNTLVTSSAGTIVANQWYHIALVRSGSSTGNVKLYINGVLASTYGSADTTNYNQGYINIGCRFDGAIIYAGFISNWRMTKGVAVYTGAFTPPTSPLGTAQGVGTNIAAVTPSQVSLLVCNGPGFRDSSPNAFAITTVGTLIASQFTPFSSFSAISRSATQTQTVLTSGSGTYYPPSGVAWLRIRMVGGGGGGAVGGGGAGGGSNGTNTTFGTSLLTAGGGSGASGSASYIVGAGGTASIGSGATGIALSGAAGFAGPNTIYPAGGNGGSTAFGGGGAGAVASGSAGPGSAAGTNSGAGGGGGNNGSASSSWPGAGGGGGGYVEAYISSPAASYAYTVGAGGGGGAASGSGGAGGGGGSGVIIIEENYAVSATTSGVYSAEYLIVAGGAGGYGNWGGGGGAGGVVTGGTTFVAGTTYTMTVGAGGAAATDGVNSYINNLGVQAYGGGTGRGALGGNGSNGGSGGGAGGNQSGATTNGGSGISGQGSNGGGAIPNVNPGGGGGGGAAYPGVQSTGTVAGNGGSGILNTITGSSVTYAGGGGGGNGAGQTAGTGGAGGGGNGATATGASVVNGTAGTANLGGGGGGGSTNGGLGGAGGSGVIIISIPTANYTARTTGSPTVTTNGIYTVLKFTASGTYTA